jgi:beta-glucanase (GH16 family)
MTLGGENYVLTFNDEFNSNPNRFYEGHGSGGIWASSFSPHLEDGRYIDRNGENQYYVDPSDSTLPNPFSTSSGHISISAQELTPAQQALANGQQYSSGLLTTELSFHLGSGYIEISADIPDEQGLLSAFWLLPADGDWSSEIDVFEILGHDTDKLHTNLWDDGTPDQQTITIPGLGSGFHTYGLHWTDTTISWIVDGVTVRQVPNTVTEPMYLAVSLAVDTTWTGSPDATTDFSNTLDIDYIRVYELDSDPDRNDAVPAGQDFTPTDLYTGTSAAETLYGTRWADILGGEDGNDTLYGREGRDSLTGAAGADALYGERGRDELTGGDGADSLIGGRGSDTLEGGAGNDHLWGGTYSSGFGDDVFVMKTGMNSDYVHDFNVTDDMLDLSTLGVTWADVSAALTDLGWATQLNLGHFGGSWGDQIFLIGVDASDLTIDNFDFGLIA